MQRLLHFLSTGAAALLILLIRVYQNTLGLILPPACRHEPSCSRYAEQVLKEYGALRGGWLTVKRLLSCHPWGKGS